MIPKPPHLAPPTDDTYGTAFAEGYQTGWQDGYADGYAAAQTEHQPDPP